MQKTVDIIIPVYKGYLESLNCLHSVLASKKDNKINLNVIVINDKSPDEKICSSLEKLSKSNLFTLIINEENLGFVKTVNLGMQQTQNDVILLNSDTEVAGNWVDKLSAHTCTNISNQSNNHLQNVLNIATVTPFSNNATICSYPLFCENNEIEKGRTVDDMNYLCEKVSPNKSIDIPTGIGFCLYITRNSLNELGLFDAESFVRGYGEENDFCMRAIKAGYRNIFALDTFVKHAGSVSFSEERFELQEQATKTLANKHPDYKQKLDDYIKNDPAQGARFAMFLFELRDHEFDEVIFNYDDFQRTNLRKDENEKIIHVSLANGKVVITNKLLITNVVVDDQDNQKETKIADISNIESNSCSNFDACAKVMSLLNIKKKTIMKDGDKQPQLVNLFNQINPKAKAIMHLINNTGGGTCRYVQDIANNDKVNRHYILYFNAKNQVYYDVTNKDYSVLNLFDEKKNKFNMSSILKNIDCQVDYCKFHLHSFYGGALDVASDLISVMSGIATLHDHYFLTDQAFSQNKLIIDTKKINEIKELAKKLDILIAPSKYIYGLATTYLPKEKITMIEHGVDKPAEKLTDLTKELAKNLMLDTKWDPREPVIAIVGAISEQKGLYFLEKIKKQLKCQIVLIGYTAMSLVPKTNKKFIQHGPYHQAELPELIKYYGANMVLFLPGIAESYCYSLSDINAVVPVIAPDCGSFSKRVIEEGLGKLYPPSLSARQLKAEIINYLAQKPTVNASIRGVTAMIEETQKYYENVAIGEWQQTIITDEQTKELIEENFDEHNFKLALVHLAKDNYFLKKDIQALFATKKIGVIDELRIKAYPYKIRFLNLINMIKNKGVKKTLLTIYKRIKYFFAR